MIRRLLKALFVLGIVAALVAVVLWYLLRPPAIAMPEQARLILSGLTVIDPGLTRRAHQTIVIDGDRIGAIADDGTVALPDSGSARRYAGKFALPGLIDMHAHHPTPFMVGEYRLWDLLYLTHGVTTVRDAGSPDGSRTGNVTLGIRDEWRSGTLAGPRVFTCGQILNSIGIPPGARVVRTPAEGRAAVEDLAAAGVDCVKVYSHLSPETLAAIRSAAAEHKLRVIGHVPLSVSLAEAHLDDAQHFFGIGERVPLRRFADVWGGWADIDDARIATIVRESQEEHIAHTPTLVVYEHMSRLLDSGNGTNSALTLLPRHWRELTWTPNGALYFPLTAEEAAGLRAALPKMRTLLRRLHDAGVRVHVGSDALMPHVVPGASLHEEMQEFVQAGLTPEETWVAATRHAGEWLGEPLLGTLQPGAPADLLIFGADPTQDLAALTTLEAVIANGRLYTNDWLAAARQRYLHHFDGTVYTSFITGVERVIRRVTDLISAWVALPAELNETRGRASRS